MKKNLIYGILIVFGLLIAYILIGDVLKSNLKKTVKNPYAYDLGDIKKIDPDLVKFTEKKRIAVAFSEPKSIDYHFGLLAIGYKNHLQIIDTLGHELFNKSIAGPVTAIAFTPEGDILLGLQTYIENYSPGGELLHTWPLIDSSAYITSIAVYGDKVFVADAGDPSVIQYTRDGELLHKFDGRNRKDRSYGFVIPSAYFDVDFDREGRLWVANTGVQEIENYSYNGALISSWGESSHELSGFIGCCNPSHFTILTDNSFVTCEKGLVRIKVYLPSGELESVVAGPDDFDKDSDPADLTSDELNNIYALDISRKMIRKFERKQSL
jgi:hypothetical protein